MVDNSVNALYPQPVQNPLASPGAIFDLVNRSNALQEFNAKQAVGTAYQNALNPDGSVDQNRLASGLKDPSASLAAPWAIGTMLDQRGKMIANDAAAFGLSSGQNAAAMGILAGLAQKEGLTYQDVQNVAPTLARMGIPAGHIAGWLKQLPRDPSGLRSVIGTVANTVMGPAASAAPISAPPDPVTGAPRQMPLGGTNYGVGARPTALPPGDAAVLEANKAELANDQTQAGNIMANARSLQSAMPLIGQLSNANFGPGSPEFAKLKGTLTTMGVIDPSASDLQVRQQAAKYLLKYAQGAQNAGRSDQALSAALGSNPNLDLTQPANMHLIQSQVAMDRMDAAKATAFTNGFAAPGQSYKDFKSSYYQNFDQRAFQWDMLSPEDRRKALQDIGPSKLNKNGVETNQKYAKFARSYALAKGAGFFQPSGQPQ